MKKIVVVFFAFLCLIPARSHTSYETYFRISEKEDVIEVKAIFSWKLREALIKYHPELVFSKKSGDFKKAMNSYVQAHFKLYDEANKATQLVDLWEEQEKEHLGDVVFTLIFKSAKVAKIENSMLFNINKNQRNYHISYLNNDKISFETNANQDAYVLRSLSTNNDHESYFFVVFLFIGLLIIGIIIVLKEALKELVYRLNATPNFWLIFMICFVSISCAKDSLNENIVVSDSTTNERPNILLIIADDLGLDATPGYHEGEQKPLMPTMDNLINSGLKFDNVWATPLCSPTRSTILTGKYGIETGVLAVGNQISTNELSIQQHLENELAGVYNTGLIGKWHLTNDANDPTLMGIDYFAGLLQGGVGSYVRWNLTVNGETSIETTYATTKFTDLAIDWIKIQTKPWFLWLSYNAPHQPYHLPPTNLHTQGNLPTDENSIANQPQPYYFAALEALDTEMGRLFNSFDAEVRENTIIIFIGDNGSPNEVVQLPYSSQRAKGSLHQGGIHVPLVVSGKGVFRIGESENALINSTDLFATIAEVAGADGSIEKNSVSFHSLLSTTGNSPRSFAYTEIEETNKSGYTIRNHEYKLIVFNDGVERFYNLKNDPYENDNLMRSGLSDTASAVKAELIQKAQEIRSN